MSKSFAISIVGTLRDRGHLAYLVGGCVRDLVLGREPADYDVATDATPEEVMRIFPETYAVGAQFGVVLVPLPDNTQKSVIPSADEISSSEVSSESRNLLVAGDIALNAQHVEVATFRSDVGYSNGRHPDQVRFSKDPREDVQRRDFTINGLLLDPVSDEVLDYVGGQNDIAAKVIRAIGDAALRFAEDKLRMLRAIRFAARFEYTIEPVTFAAIQRLAPQIHQVSRERVRDELTLLLLENLPQPCPITLAWGALLHDVGKPPTFRLAPDRIRFDDHVDVGVKMAEVICRRLRFSNDDSEQILALVDNHMRFMHVDRMKYSTFKKFVRLPRFEEHLELHRLDCESSHRNLRIYNLVREKLAELPPSAIRPEPLVTGDDLIGAGYQPGPQFKQILAAVEDAQLEGRLQSKKQALQLVRREFPLESRSRA